MRRFAALLILALLAPGCSQRERANPLDPSNPQTGGRPEGFVSLAGYSSVSLRWTSRPDLAIDGFQVLRLDPGDADFHDLSGVLSHASGNFLDAGVVNGRTYAYRLYYVIEGQRALVPAEDRAMPGPLRPWVADYGGALVRLSPDGRHVAERFSNAGRAQSVAVDPSDGRVWSTSSQDGLVTTRDPGGIDLVRITGMSRPFSIAVTPLDHSAWICDLTGSLSHYAFDGSPVSPASIPLLVTPSSVAVDPRDYSFWVCENEGDRIRHFSSGGIPMAAATLSAPSRVAVDSVTQIAWVTSLAAHRVWRVSPSGAILDTLPVASGPIGIAIDRYRDRVWIADAVGNRVVVLDPLTRAVLFTVGGLAEPRDVAVDLATGEAWVAARAEGAIYRISRDGAILERCGGLIDPYEVRLDPGMP